MSDFARQIAKVLKDNKSLMEFGSHDALFFAKCGFKVTAIDSCYVPMPDCVTFVHGDMIYVHKEGFRTFYASFSMDDMTTRAQEQLLLSIPQGSDLYVETRSDQVVALLKAHKFVVTHVPGGKHLRLIAHLF